MLEIRSTRGHRLARVITASALGALLVLLPACRLSDDDNEYFTIRVDNVIAPDSIDALATLLVRFTGKIGPDQCSRFDHVEQRSIGAGVEFHFRGARKRNSDCGQMPVSLYYERRLPPPLPDPYTIRVVQPDGTNLEKVIRVRTWE